MTKALKKFYSADVMKIIFELPLKTSTLSWKKR